MKERVGGRQRSFFFLLVFSCLEIPLIAGKALALCSGGSSWGARGTRDPTPPPLIFSQNRAPKGRKKNVLRPGSFVSLGLDDPHPPSPPLSEGLHSPLLCQSKFLAPSHFLYIGQSILSAQLINVHFVCATLTTPVFLFFFFIKQERISRHLSLGLLVIFVLSLMLWPKSSDLLHRRGLAECWDCWNCNLEVSTFSLFNFWLEPGKTINLILVLFCRLYLLRCCLNFLIWNKQALTEISEIIFYRRCHWSGLG